LTKKPTGGEGERTEAFGRDEAEMRPRTTSMDDYLRLAHMPAVSGDEVTAALAVLGWRVVETTDAESTLQRDGEVLAVPRESVMSAEQMIGLLANARITSLAFVSALERSARGLP
jgi:hypothetical protein